MEVHPELGPSGLQVADVGSLPIEQRKANAGQLEAFKRKKEES
jgi:hypothetical protein